MTHQSLKPRHSTECATTAPGGGNSAQGAEEYDGSVVAGAQARSDSGNSGGMLDMRFSESVADALSRLYSSPVSAVQEIIANSVTACKTAERLYGERDAHIRVHIRGRNMAIEDRNSLGMPREVFRDAYARAGRSLKVADGSGCDLPGLFGCGSLSYVLLSDIMFLETHSRATGEKYAVMACDGRGFQTGIKAPAFEWFGTRVRLTIRKSVDMGSILDRIVDISKACGVRIEIDLDRADPECVIADEDLCEAPGYEDGEAVDEDGEALLDTANGIGRRTGEGDPYGGPPEYRAPVSERYVFRALTFGALVELTGGNRGGWDRTGGTDEVCVRAESPDLEVAAFCTCNMYGDDRDHRTWLAGMPIGSTYGDYAGEHDALAERWSVWIYVKNERRYMPTPDRERFPDLVLAELGRDAKSLLRGRLAEIRPGTLPEYLSDPANRAIEPLAANYTVSRWSAMHKRNREKINTPYISDWLDEGAARLARAAGPVVLRPDDDGSSLWQALYADRCDGERSSSPIEAPLLLVGERLYAGLRDRVVEHARADGHKNVVVFAPHPRNTVSADDYVAMGCVSVVDYAKWNGLLRGDDDLYPVDEAGEPIKPQPRPRPQRQKAPNGRRTYVVHYGDIVRASDGTAMPKLASERVLADYETGRTVVSCLGSESFTALRNVLAALNCQWTGVTTDKSAACGVIDYEDYADAAAEAEYQTSMGPMTGNALAECKRRVVLCEYDQPAATIKGLARLLAARRTGADDNVVYVLGSTRDLAGCAAHLWRAGAEYAVWMPPFYNTVIAKNMHCLDGKKYLEGLVDAKHGPTDAAAEWIGGFSSVSASKRGFGRTAVLQMLHGHLVGAELLKEAGLDYGKKLADDSEGEA